MEPALEKTWNEVSGRAGRNELPALLANAVLVESTITNRTEIARGIRKSWTNSEYPTRLLSPSVWQYLFVALLKEGEYLNEVEVRSIEELPTETTLWRGAIPSRAGGMSWTDDRDRAIWFAQRFNEGLSETGYLYRLTVSPDMVLARFSEARGESEWVLDPDLVNEASPQQQVIDL